MIFPWHYYLMAFLYILAGLNHFVKPKMYQKIMPYYIPAPKAMVFWSGVAECVLGVSLLFPKVHHIGLWGIIFMLILFFSVHIHMLQDDKIRSKFPLWLLWLRIPFQFLLIYWSYTYLNF